MIYVSLSRQYKFCHNCHPDTSFEGSMALPSGKYFVDGKSIHFNVNIASSLVGWFSVGGGGGVNSSVLQEPFLLCCTVYLVWKHLKQNLLANCRNTYQQLILWITYTGFTFSDLISVIK
jgi:hypothetical protein